MINKSKVLIGSDFEMFLVDKKGKVISAIPFNEGTKAHPERIKGSHGCCIQRDGILEECNVPPVTLEEGDDFWYNILLVKDYINKKFAKDKGLELICCPTRIVEEDQLQHDEAKQIGCSVDFNAWNGGEINTKPEFDNTGLRSAGFHVHMSVPDCTVQMCIDIMKLFDLFLTVPFVLIDKDKERRKLYGKAGAFRTCDYGDAQGLEARTLSGIVSSKQEYIDFLFNQLNLIFDYYNTEGLERVDKFADKIIQCINNSDEDLAKEICSEFNIFILLESDSKYKRREELICVI